MDYTELLSVVKKQPGLALLTRSAVCAGSIRNCRRKLGSPLPAVGSDYETFADLPSTVARIAAFAFSELMRHWFISVS